MARDKSAIEYDIAACEQELSRLLFAKDQAIRKAEREMERNSSHSSQSDWSEGLGNMIGKAMAGGFAEKPYLPRINEKERELSQLRIELEELDPEVKRRNEENRRIAKEEQEERRRKEKIEEERERIERQEAKVREEMAEQLRQRNSENWYVEHKKKRNIMLIIGILFLVTQIILTVMIPGFVSSSLIIIIIFIALLIIPFVVVFFVPNYYLKSKIAAILLQILMTFTYAGEQSVEGLIGIAVAILCICLMFFSADKENPYIKEILLKK